MTVRRQPPVTSRMGAILFALGAAVTAAAIVAPHSPQMDVRGFWVLFAVELGFAAFLYVLPRDVGRGLVPPFILAAGIVAVTAAIALNGERDGGAATINELFYVWPALYVGYFFRPHGIATAVASIAVAYAWVLGFIGIPRDTGTTRWLIVVAVAAGAALALHALRRQVDRLLAQLRDAASTDALTGLLNRRGFEERFAFEIARATRADAPLSLVFGDLDLFKRLNDQFGHASGDRALAQVADVLRRCSRASDIAARIGGEEFAVLLADTDAPGAFVVAERLRAAVGVVRDDDGVPLTMSFGVATRPDDGASTDDLMRAADAALYEAKGLGRDRTVAA